MSRLDDELRNAFRRESPPADFTERLLARLSQAPAPKLSWWQKLAMLLEPPKLRWVAIGVTASLLLAIGAAQYSRLNQVVKNDDATTATKEPASGPGTTDPAAVTNDHAPQDVTATIVKPVQGTKRTAVEVKHRLIQARHHEERELKLEGEAAKEKLLLALSIASSALSDAQKAVRDDNLMP